MRVHLFGVRGSGRLPWFDAMRVNPGIQIGTAIEDAPAKSCEGRPLALVTLDRQTARRAEQSHERIVRPVVDVVVESLRGTTPGSYWDGAILSGNSSDV